MVLIENLLKPVMYFGIPLIVFLTSLFFLFWRRDYSVFWGLNILMALVYMGVAVVLSGSDDHLPGLTVFVFGAFILLPHMIVSLILSSIKLALERRKARRLTDV